MNLNCLYALEPGHDRASTSSIQHGLDKCFSKRTTGQAIINRGRTYLYSLWPVHTWLSSTRERGRAKRRAWKQPFQCARLHAPTNTRPCHSAVQITQVAKAHGRGKIRSACMLELGEWSDSPCFQPCFQPWLCSFLGAALLAQY